MAAGLREELELDVSDALSDVDKLDAALHQTAQGFKREISQATNALRGANGQFVARMRVDGDGEVRAARREVDQLDDSVRRVEKDSGGLRDRFGELKTAAAAIGGALVVREVFDQLHKAVDAASDLAESTSKVTTVFGDSSGVILDWSKTSATALGLTQQAALEFGGTFGNLFTALGLADDAAAALSPQVVQLGADLASFNNLPVDEALEKLRSGLVGEIEPLRSLGVSFNAAQVESKAMSLGLADANGVISEGAKVQARWALIVEQSSAAAGDFARTSGGLANQQRILTAEAGNLRAEIGEALLPVALELVSQFREALPHVKDLAQDAVPVLSSSIRVLVPIGLSMLDLLVAMAPVLEVVADLIELLPEPVLQGAAAFGLLGTGLGPMPNLIRQFTTAAMTAPSGMSAWRAGFAALNPWVVGISLALPILTSAMSSNRAEQARQKRAVQDTAAAYGDLSQTIEEANESLAEARIKEKNQLDDLDRLGVSYDEFARTARGGAEAHRAFVQSLVAAGEVRIDKRAIGGDVIDDLAGALEHFGSLQAVLNAGIIRGNDGLVRSLIDLAEQYQSGARFQLNDLVAKKDLTRQAVREAEANHKLADGTTDYVAVLKDLRPASAEASAETDALGVAADGAGESLDEMRERLEGVTDALRDFFDEQREGLKTEADFQAALDDLIGGFKENGRTLDINTEKGRANLDGILKTRDALLDVAARRFEETGSIDEATAALGEHREELRRELEQANLTDQQISDYLDTLGLTPEEVRTRLIVEDAEARGMVVGFVQFMEAVGEDAAVAFVAGIVNGFRDGEGTVVGSADSLAHAIETSVRRRLKIESPSRVGIEIGGLFVEGITIGVERESQLAAQASASIGTNLAEAFMRGATITNAEALDIFDAVAALEKAEENLTTARRGGRGTQAEVIAGEKALQDARESLWNLAESGTATEIDLADARQKIADAEAELNVLRNGGTVTATELRRAELELAAAQEAVNDAIFESRDATAELTAEWERMNDALNDGVSALTALRGLRDAKETVTDLRKEAAKANDVLTGFDQRIADVQQQLASATVQRMHAGGTVPTDEERRLRASLDDLVRRRAGAADAAASANESLTDALLDEVLATQQLVNSAVDAGPALGQWEEFLRGLGTAAGLSKEEVDDLVRSLEQATYLAAATRNSLLAGTPITVPAGATAQTAGSGASTIGGVHVGQLGPFFTTEPEQTASEVIGELKVLQVTSVG